VLSAVVIVGRTPVILASALKDASALRPTSTGLLAGLGIERLFDGSEKESSDTCTTLGT